LGLINIVITKKKNSKPKPFIVQAEDSCLTETACLRVRWLFPMATSSLQLR